jgi:Uncharacterized conserved domain (SAYSvFN)
MILQAQRTSQVCQEDCQVTACVQINNTSLFCRLCNSLCELVIVPKTCILNSKLSRVVVDFSTSHPKLSNLIQFALWVVLWVGFVVVEFGTVFFMVSLFYVVYKNTRTGPVKDNAPSAYSVFNPNCERITGTFTAEQFESHLRRGGML